MTENQKEAADSENSNPVRENREEREMGNQKISVSESFVVDMESPRITLQRSLTRKGSYRGEKKMKSNTGEDKETGGFDTATTTIPKASLDGGSGSTPEKLMVVTANGAPINPQLHHQITIVTTAGGSTTTAAAMAEGKLGGRRFSFRRSSSSRWAINPRRVLMFFATLSSMGTILLIYLTLSISKQSSMDENAATW